MFNYKRLTFIFIFLSFLLTVTDSQIEKQVKKSLLSFVNIVVEEGSEVGESAPGSFLDSLEAGRIGMYNFFEKQGTTFAQKGNNNKGALSFVFSFLKYFFNILQFLSSYVITFYPVLLFMLYMFFASRLFRRNDSYDNYYGNY